MDKRVILFLCVVLVVFTGCEETDQSATETAVAHVSTQMQETEYANATGTETERLIMQSATAFRWTKTPTPTSTRTPTATPTPTITPTHTPEGRWGVFIGAEEDELSWLLDDNSNIRDLRTWSEDSARYLVRLQRSDEEVQVCEYTGGTRRRVRRNIEAIITDRETSSEIGHGVFYGGLPDGCPTVTNTLGAINGSLPSAATFETWFRQVLQESGSNWVGLASMPAQLVGPAPYDRPAWHEDEFPYGVFIQAGWENADLLGANLSHAYLWGANLRGADLTWAELIEAHLTGANLEGALLTEANLQGAALTNANLAGADLSGANLRKADMVGTHLSNALFDENTILPDDYPTLQSYWTLDTDLSRYTDPEHPQFWRGFDLQGADLHGIDFSGAHLRGVDLHEANLRDADLQGTDLTRANLQEADLTDALFDENTILPDDSPGHRRFWTPDTDLSRYTDPEHPQFWRGYDLQGADLRRADFSDANLRGADLREANLEGANLTNSDLQGADLTGANLEEADLTNTQFDENTILPDHSSGYRGYWILDIDGHRSYWTLDTDLARFTDPAHPQFWRGYDLQGADLRGANLRGANLHEANLAFADLTNADLQGADLTGANLRRAGLRGAILTDAQFDYGTILPAYSGNQWTPDKDMNRYTDPDHPDFWCSDDPNSPAYCGNE